MPPFANAAAGALGTPILVAELIVIAAVAIAAVTFSWALIQVDYMLRYAHRYYSRVEDGARGDMGLLHSEDR